MTSRHSIRLTYLRGSTHMSSSFLRKEISMAPTMAKLVLWRQKLFPHLKKNLTAVLVILKTLERSLLCLWRSSRSSLRRRASESLHDPAQEMMKLPLMTTRREHVTSIRSLGTTSLSSLVGKREEEEEEQGIWFWWQEEEEILKVFFQVLIQVFIS